MTLDASTPVSRPLGRFTLPELAARMERALADRDGVTGAHCIHEMWMRGDFAIHIERALERLWACAAADIPDWLPMRHFDWLAVAYEVSRQFRAMARGRTNIYLVLLDFSDRRGEPYGVYVGMSQYRPAQRFDQHKAGIRAAGSVLKRGIEVLTGPTLHLQNMNRAEGARIEGELAEALRDAGLVVEGGH